MLERDSRGSWIAVCVLGLAVSIGYVDRVVISMAAPIISKEYGFGPEIMGALLSAFSWAYFFALLPSGWLIDRYGPKLVLTVGYLVWSVACAATGLSTSIAMLFLCRVALGVGEAPLYPCGVALTQAGFSERNRGLASAIYSEGAKIGPAIGAPLAATLLATFGWREMFALIGLGFLFWLPLWHFLVPPLKVQRSNGANKPTAPHWKATFLHRDVLGMMLGSFGYLYVLWFYLSWLPSYLMQERGLAVVQAGIYTALPFLIQVFTSLAGGYVADRMIEAGHSATLVRKSSIGIGLLLGTAIVPAAFAETVGTAVALFCVSLAGIGILVPNALAVPARLAAEGRGAIVGSLSLSAGFLGGAMAPLLTGFILKNATYSAAFLLAGGMLLVSAAGYLIILRKIEPLRLEHLVPAGVAVVVS
jgi:MFS family permease